MGRTSKPARRRGNALRNQALAAAKNQRFGSFEPDMNVPQIRMRAAEDETETNECPMTEEEREKDDADVEARQQMLTVAMDADAQVRQNQPFFGSVYEHTIAVCEDAERGGAGDMCDVEWKQFHEEMYAKHLPFSAACYKVFRRAARGNALNDQEFVKLLLIGKLRESRRMPEKLLDGVAAKYVTKRHMYNQLRRDVEEKREAAAASATVVATTEPETVPTNAQSDVIESDDAQNVSAETKTYNEMTQEQFESELMG